MCPKTTHMLSGENSEINIPYSHLLSTLYLFRIISFRLTYKWIENSLCLCWSFRCCPDHGLCPLEEISISNDGSGIATSAVRDGLCGPSSTSPAVKLSRASKRLQSTAKLFHLLSGGFYVSGRLNGLWTRE